MTDGTGSNQRPITDDDRTLQAVRAMVTVLHGTWDHPVLFVLRHRPLRQVDIQHRLEHPDGEHHDRPDPLALPDRLSRKVLRETLHRLEELGLVRHEPSHDSFPREVWYELTPDGHTILDVAHTMGEHATRVLPVLDAVLRRRIHGTRHDADHPHATGGHTRAC